MYSYLMKELKVYRPVPAVEINDGIYEIKVLRFIILMMVFGISSRFTGISERTKS